MPLPFVDRSTSSLAGAVCRPAEMAGVAEGAERGAARLARIAPALPEMPAISRVLPGRDGKAAGAVLVLSAKPTLWDFGALATRLPAGTWRARVDTAPVSPTDAAVAIGLGTWRFERYKAKKGKAGAEDHVAAGRRQGARHGDDRVDLSGARSHHHAVVRHGAGRAGRRRRRRSAKTHEAKIKVIVGDDLLKQNYPDDPRRRPRQQRARRG